MKNNDEIQISFIIPAYNEENFIENLLKSIKYLVVNFKYEIIVIDNGSTDSTINIIKKYNTILMINSEKTIAGLRNLGASIAKGRLLVFLDADVVITQKWVDHIPDVFDKIINRNTKMITGSRCGISLNPTWIEKYWFQPKIQEIPNYINSGHLIIERILFYDLEGFDESLVTGEDYEFCMRAKEKDVFLENNPDLYVIHDGYPKNALSFFKREKWHGFQDVRSFSDFIRSKVAIMSTVYCLIIISGLSLYIFTGNFIFIFLSIFLNAILCLGATIYNSSRYRLNWLAYFLIYNIYFLARGMSWLDRFKQYSISPKSWGRKQ